MYETKLLKDILNYKNFIEYKNIFIKSIEMNNILKLVRI